MIFPISLQSAVVAYTINHERRSRLLWFFVRRREKTSDGFFLLLSIVSPTQKGKCWNIKELAYYLNPLYITPIRYGKEKQFQKKMGTVFSFVIWSLSIHTQPIRIPWEIDSVVIVRALLDLSDVYSGPHFLIIIILFQIKIRNAEMTKTQIFKRLFNTWI